VGWHEPLISRFVCSLAGATIVASKKIAERIPGDVIPCGVDLAVFEPKPKAEARQRLNLDSQRKYILFPFNPARSIKRFDLASGAVTKMEREEVDIELLTVSKVPNAEMPWYYSAADAMILCSDSEGSSTSVKEALACNLPVVATDVGDVREIMSGIEGTRICTHEVGEIARGLREVLETSHHGRFHGRMAMTRYDETRTADKIVRLYRDVARRFRTRGERRCWLRVAGLSGRTPARKKRT